MVAQVIARVKDEHDQLANKFAKLQVFTRSAEFRKLSRNHRRLLEMQEGAMAAYLGILSLRLEEFQHGES